jgi:hypothetical protein
VEGEKGMTPSAVWTGIKTALENDSTLDDYIVQVLDGQREIDSITSYPTIVLDYAGSQEVDDTYGRQRITMSVTINIVINVFNKDKQIVGDTTNKGVLDIINDVKNAIDADRTLGGAAIHTQILSDSLSTQNFPVRVLTLNCNILFEQDEGTR